MRNTTKSRSTAFDKKVGERIRARRNEIGLTQRKLAERVGVSFPQIQKYESGDNSVRLALLPDIAEALQTSVNELIGDLFNKKGKTHDS